MGGKHRGIGSSGGPINFCIPTQPPFRPPLFFPLVAIAAVADTEGPIRSEERPALDVAPSFSWLVYWMFVHDAHTKHVDSVRRPRSVMLVRNIRDVGG